MRWSKDTFVARGIEHHYALPDLFDLNNSERVVEIALGKAIIEAHAGKRILEIGATMQEYIGGDWPVIDKHEVAPHTQNMDVIDLKAEDAFDLVVSISTLEHVGWNEFMGRPDAEPSGKKILEAIRVCKRALAPGGLLAVTMPLGYNHLLDDIILEGKLPFQTLTFLQRVDAENHWSEVSLMTILASPPRYGSPWPNANAIVYGTYKRLGYRLYSAME